MNEEGGFFQSAGFWLALGAGQGWGAGALEDNYTAKITGLGFKNKPNRFAPSKFFNTSTGKAVDTGFWNRRARNISNLWKHGPEVELQRARSLAFARYQEQALSRSLRAGSKAYSQGAGAMARSFGKTFSTYAQMGGKVELPLYGEVGGAIGRGLGIGRLATSILARGAFTALNALFVADLTRAVVGGSIGTLIEMGKPRELQPRFYHTPLNMTMRQAALSAISSSQLSTRSAFSNEASYLHG